MKNEKYKYALLKHFIDDVEYWTMENTLSFPIEEHIINVIGSDNWDNYWSEFMVKLKSNLTNKALPTTIFLNDDLLNKILINKSEITENIIQYFILYRTIMFFGVKEESFADNVLNITFSGDNKNKEIVETLINNFDYCKINAFETPTWLLRNRITDKNKNMKDVYMINIKSLINHSIGDSLYVESPIDNKDIIY